jgi:FSR family fosmidomycin resistance protein-like MFS transporter
METASETKFKTGKVTIIAFSHFVHDIYSAFLAPILPLLIEKLSLSYSMAGLLILLLRIPAIISPWIGLLTERISTRYFVIFAPSVTALAMSSVGLTNNYFVLCSILFLAGLSSAIYHVPSPVMIKNLSGNRVGTGMSFYMFGGELARTIGPLIILTAISLWGLEGSFKVIFIGIIATILLFIQIKDIPVRIKSNNNNKPPTLLEVIKLRKEIFIISGALVLSKSFMILALTSYLPIYMTNKGASLWLAGVALSVIELSGAAGTFLSGSLSDKIGRRNMLFITTLLAPVFMLIFVFSKGWLLFPILIILGLLVFAVSPVVMAYVLENEKEYPATANSIFMALNFGVGSIVALFIGFLGDSIDLDMTYISTALLSLVGLPFILKMPKKNYNH